MSSWVTTNPSKTSLQCSLSIFFSLTVCVFAAFPQQEVVEVSTDDTKFVHVEKLKVLLNAIEPGTIAQRIGIISFRQK